MDYYTQALYLAQDEEQELRDQITRHFDFGGLCSYCGTPFAADWGGWYMIFPDDDDQIGPGDLFVAKWCGWFRLCEYCNRDGDRWPEGDIILAPEDVGDCATCTDAARCTREGPSCGS
jgi:hypothetical protein